MSNSDNTFNICGQVKYEGTTRQFRNHESYRTWRKSVMYNACFKAYNFRGSVERSVYIRVTINYLVCSQESFKVASFYFLQ